jgi:Heparinase II/III-like protein
LLETAGEIFNQPQLLYVASNGRRGIPPLRRCADFLEAGYFVQRSAFDRLSHKADTHRSLIFDCGPIGDGGHGHYDALSIDMWCGRHLLVDPGRYSYDASSRWRQWFKGTAAHNTVCVDGLDQTRFRPGKPRRPARTRLLTRYSSGLLDVVGGEVVSSEYDAIHRRHVFFIAGEYWIVLDELEAVGPHDYDLRFHLAPESSGAIDLAHDQLAVPGLRLLFDGPGQVAIEDGWMSPQYGLKLPAPVVSKRAARHRSARFITVIAPLDAPNSGKPFTLAASPSADVIGTVVVGVHGPHEEHVDRLTWRTAESGSCHAALERRNR